VLQEREIERIGSNKKIKVDFRLISSTNRNLKQEVTNGNFREDLFYRINVIEIIVPPLRDRMDDIPLLVSEFVSEFCLREKKKLIISEQVMSALQNYSWPGNIRQLRNIVERSVVLSKAEIITLKEIPDEILPRKREEDHYDSIKTFRELEIQAIKDSLSVCNGNKSKASRMLGISRKAFYKRLSEFEL